MKTNQKNIGIGFWLAWVLASAIGFSLGMFPGLAVAYGIFREGFDVMQGITAGIIAGAVSGLTQWLILRQQVARSGFWVVASSLGFGIALGALASGVGKNDVTAAILMALAFSLGGGILQWLILRSAKIALAGLWIFASLLGSLLGAMGFPVSNALGAPDSYALHVLVFGILFGAGLGTVSGAVLVWLLRQTHANDIQGLATVD